MVILRGFKGIKSILEFQNTFETTIPTTFE